MYSKYKLAYRWIQHSMQAYNGRGHGIHSPFVYDFVKAVLNDRASYYAYEKIRETKLQLLKDDRIIHVEDFGAGSMNKVAAQKRISRIASGAVSSEKFGRLLFRLANYYRANMIIELGSSLGISTAYLAAAKNSSRVLTLEGSPVIATIATENFNRLGLKNIFQVTGNFENTLSGVITSNPPADLVFIDGNHRKKPVLEYFESFLNRISPASLIIIHDIHWSREMEEAWNIIRQDSRVKMSIDIFSAGLVFFREEFKVKQHFIIRF